MKGSLIRLLSPEIGQVEGIDIAVVVLIVNACPRFKGRIKHILSVLPPGSKKEHGKPRLPQGAKLPADPDIRRKYPVTPENKIGLLAFFWRQPVFKNHSLL